MRRRQDLNHFIPGILFKLLSSRLRYCSFTDSEPHVSMIHSKCTAPLAQANKLTRASCSIDSQVHPGIVSTCINSSLVVRTGLICGVATSIPTELTCVSTCE